MMKSDLRPMRDRIWRALLCASDQEIHDGMHFYQGAHGLCRFFSFLSSSTPVALTPRHVAGIYAALSPMNTWDTNVANILDVLRDWSSASVNTTDINLHKALRIRCGEEPENVLSGRKVLAFFRAMANPDDATPIAVDRHLVNLALGVMPSKNEQSAYASDDFLYSRIESVYHDLGKRERIGNRLASIAWFVQRRIERTGQIHLPHPDSPICCNSPMSVHGMIGSRRFTCRVCKSTRHEPDRQIDGYRLGTNKNRTIIYLGLGHPYANRWGWQYLSRYRISKDLGRPLRPDEHVHHIDHDKTNDHPSNLKLMIAEYHGRHHGLASVLARYRDELGRFVEDPAPHVRRWPRQGAVLGTEATI